MREWNIPVICEGRIDPRQIPDSVAKNLAQTAIRGILRDYADPAIQEEYRRWRAERGMTPREAMA